jgi:hypothetical protein
VVDVFLADMNERDFKEREYIFRENMAYASNISVVNVDIRFSLSVSSVSSRKLLDNSQDFFKVNTALYGDEQSIFDALTASVDLGIFPEMMEADGFNVSYMTAMYPDKVTLYDAAVSPRNTSMAMEGSSEPFYAPLSLVAFICICAGGGVAVILLVVGLCYFVSRRKRKAAEKAREEQKVQRQKEASKFRKIVQENGLAMGGKTMPRPNEVRIDAYTGVGRLSSAREMTSEDRRTTTARSFTQYLLDGSTPAETPRYSTATPRHDEDSMGQLTRRASSMTEPANPKRELSEGRVGRDGRDGREAVITPRLPSGTTPRERPPASTPRGSSFSNATASPRRSAQRTATPKHSTKSQYAEY